MRILISAFFLVFILGCSSSPTEKEIIRSIYGIYNTIDPCPSVFLKYTLNNTIPGADKNRLILNIDLVFSTGKDRSAEETQIENTIWDVDKFNKQIKIFKDKNRKDLIECNKIISCKDLEESMLELDIIRHKNNLLRQQADSITELYLVGCSKKTKDYFAKKIYEQLEKNKLYSGELIKESDGKIKIVKSNNGWIFDN